MKGKVIFLDTTLRDGEQTPGVSFHVNEKVELARGLEALGVDVAEAGFAGASAGDFEAVRAVSKAVDKLRVCSLARCVEADIRAAAAALCHAKKSRIHVFIATSPLHRRHKLNMSLGVEQEIVTRADCGGGPVEACFRAVDQITGMSCKLESYRLKAVTEGDDVLGEVTVRMSHGDWVMLGKGVSTDIIQASCLAYIHAVNRIWQALQESEAVNVQQPQEAQTQDPIHP